MCGAAVRQVVTRYRSYDDIPQFHQRYFLIGVGMLIDVHVIFGHGDALKVAAVMIVVALAGKWIACYLLRDTMTRRFSSAHPLKFSARES